MKTRIVTIAAGLLLALFSAQAAFSDLLAAYITSIDNVVSILTKIRTENDAKSNAAALDAAAAAMKTAKAQVKAASTTNPAEVNAAVQQRAADLQRTTAALHEQLHRMRKSKEFSQALAAALAKLNS